MDTPILRAFVGDKADYYLASFEKISKNKTVWNWAAFFLGLGWLCYRRMYLYAAIFGALITAETIIEMMFTFPSAVSNGLTIGIWVASGMLGNTVYKAYVDKQIALIQSLPLSEEELLDAAATRGKPSVLIGFTGFFVFATVLYGIVSLMPTPS